MDFGSFKGAKYSEAGSGNSGLVSVRHFLLAFEEYVANFKTGRASR